MPSKVITNDDVDAATAYLRKCERLRRADRSAATEAAVVDAREERARLKKHLGKKAPALKKGRVAEKVAAAKVTSQGCSCNPKKHTCGLAELQSMLTF
jgi:hypothetical protein